MIDIVEKKSNLIIHLFRIKNDILYFKKELFQSNSPKSFNENKKFILDSKNINKVFHLISSIYKYLILTMPIKGKCIKPYKSQARLFLSHLLIAKSPEEVLGEEKTWTLKTRNLHRSSLRLAATFKLLTVNWFEKQYLRMFMNNFKQYMEIFLDWQKSDKEQLIGKMSHNYWELEITKKNIMISNESKKSVGTSPPNNNREEIAKSIEKMQKDIINNIQCLDKNGMEIFNQYIPIVYTHDFMENVRDTLEVVFWDNIRIEMSSIPAKTTKFKAVLQELLDNLRTICESDVNYQTDLTEFFDIDLLIEMINGNAYTIDMLVGHWQQLMGILIKYDAPVNDKTNLELNKNMIEKLKKTKDLPINILNKYIEGWILILKELLPRFINLNRIKSIFMNTNKKLKK